MYQPLASSKTPPRVVALKTVFDKGLNETSIDTSLESLKVNVKSKSVERFCRFLKGQHSLKVRQHRLTAISDYLI